MIERFEGPALSTSGVGWFPLPLVAALVLPAVSASAQAPAGSTTGSPPDAAPAGAESSQLLDLLKASAPKNEIGVSADYLFGLGTVLVPNQFGLANSDPLYPGRPTVSKGDRESDYFGSTISYSRGQAWFLDFSYAKGSSSANVDIPIPIPGSDAIPAELGLDDDWYQVYLRYTFPRFRGSRSSLYVRGGVSYVDAEISVVNGAVAGFQSGEVYRQDSEYKDLLFNLGFGYAYALKSTGALRIYAQIEGEGAIGGRQQDVLEDAPITFTSGASDEFDAGLFALQGKATMRFEYAIGRSGLFRAFVDGGVETKYSIVSYPGRVFENAARFDGDRFSELLWGPYVKMGLRYSF